MSVLDAVIGLLRRLPGEGFSVSWRFSETGYKQMARDPIRLIDAICTTYDNLNYRPIYENGKLQTTFCNMACNEIAQAMGCQDLKGLSADEIYSYFTGHPDDWMELRAIGLQGDDLDIAFAGIQSYANMGALVFAVATSIELGQDHGHICVIRPGTRKSSGKWGNVPACMNIGAECYIGLGQSGVMKGEPVGINEAFRPLPHFFLWKAGYS